MIIIVCIVDWRWQLLLLGDNLVSREVWCIFLVVWVVTGYITWVHHTRVEGSSLERIGHLSKNILISSFWIVCCHHAVGSLSETLIGLNIWMLDWERLTDLMIEWFGSVGVLWNITSLVYKVWGLFLRFKSHDVLLLVRIALTLIRWCIRSWVFLIVFSVALLLIDITLLVRMSHLVSRVFHLWLF
jgi:hypothetical protein